MKLVILFLLTLNSFAQTGTPIDDLIGGSERAGIDFTIYNNQIFIVDPVENEIIVIEADEDLEKNKVEIKDLFNLGLIFGERYESYRFRHLLIRKKRKEIIKLLKEDTSPYHADARQQALNLINQLPAGAFATLRGAEFFRMLFSISVGGLSEGEVVQDSYKLHSSEGVEIPHWESTRVGFTARMFNNFTVDFGLPVLGARGMGKASMKLIRPGKNLKRETKINPISIARTRFAQLFHGLKTFKFPKKSDQFLIQFPIPGSEVVFENEGQFVISVGGNLLPLFGPFNLSGDALLYINGSVKRTLKNISYDEEHPAVELSIKINQLAGARADLGPTIGSTINTSVITDAFEDFVLGKIRDINSDFENLIEESQNIPNSNLSSRLQLNLFSVGGSKSASDETHMRYVFDLRFSEAKDALQKAFMGNLAVAEKYNEEFKNEGIYKGIERISSVKRTVRNKSSWLDLGANGLEFIQIDDPNLSYNWNSVQGIPLLKTRLRRDNIKIDRTIEQGGLTEEQFITIKKKLRTNQSFLNVFSSGQTGVHTGVSVTQNLSPVDTTDFRITKSIAMRRLKRRFQKAFYNIAIRSFSHVPEDLNLLSQKYLNKDMCYKNPIIELGQYFNQEFLLFATSFDYNQFKAKMSQFLFGSSYQHLLSRLENSQNIDEKQKAALENRVKDTQVYFDDDLLKTVHAHFQEIRKLLLSSPTKDRSEALKNLIFKLVKNKKRHIVVSVFLSQLGALTDLKDKSEYFFFADFKSKDRSCNFHWVLEGANTLNLIETDPALQREEALNMNNITQGLEEDLMD